MRFVHVLTLVTIWLATAAGLTAQSQITTAVIYGTVVERGRGPARRKVEIRNVDTNLTRTLTTDRNGRARGAAAARHLQRHPCFPDSPRSQENVLASVGDTVRLNRR